MRRYLPALWLAWLAWLVPAGAQTLLPPSFDDWQSKSLTVRGPAQAEDLAGQDADLIREFGLLQAERREYQRGPDSLTVTLFMMTDSTAGYGVYLFLRGEEMKPAEVATFSAASRDRVLVLLGNLVVELRGAGVERQHERWKSLLAPLLAKADKTPYPSLPAHLPAPGLIQGSERYLLGNVALRRVLPLLEGDWAGFSAGAEAVFARYRRNGKEYPLLLLHFPTPKAARQRLSDFNQWFNLNAAGGPAGDRVAVSARRIQSLIVMSPTRDHEGVQPLLAQVQYEQQLTMSEPGFLATEKPLIFYIYSIFVLTGLILLFAFVAGLAFGGFRLMIKRLLPGKIFDRTEVVEVLQLGLTTKPIDARDFY